MSDYFTSRALFNMIFWCLFFFFVFIGAIIQYSSKIKIEDYVFISLPILFALSIGITEYLIHSKKIKF
jgi:hypothetical protein